jgi:malate dehydrogenase
MQSQGLSLEKYAKRDVKVLVVANPANTNMLVLLRTVTTIPKGNFTCLTRLDEERLRFVVADKINRDLKKLHGEGGGGGGGRLVRAQDVKNVFIFGNHSTTQVRQRCRIYSIALHAFGEWILKDSILFVFGLLIVILFRLMV